MIKYFARFLDRALVKIFTSACVLTVVTLMLATPMYLSAESTDQISQKRIANIVFMNGQPIHLDLGATLESLPPELLKSNWTTALSLRMYLVRWYKEAIGPGPLDFSVQLSKGNISFSDLSQVTVDSKLHLVTRVYGQKHCKNLEECRTYYFALLDSIEKPLAIDPVTKMKFVATASSIGSGSFSTLAKVLVGNTEISIEQKPSYTSGEPPSLLMSVVNKKFANCLLPHINEVVLEFEKTKSMNKRDEVKKSCASEL